MTQDIKIVEVPKGDNLEFLYEQIGCRMIDVVAFDGFDVFCNDEGLLESGNVVAEYIVDGEPIATLAGNLVVTKGVDSEGATVWFEDEDYKTMLPIIRKLESFHLRGVTA